MDARKTTRPQRELSGHSKKFIIVATDSVDVASSMRHFWMVWRVWLDGLIRLEFMKRTLVRTQVGHWCYSFLEGHGGSGCYLRCC